MTGATTGQVASSGTEITHSATTGSKTTSRGRIHGQILIPRIEGHVVLNAPLGVLQTSFGSVAQYLIFCIFVGGSDIAGHYLHESSCYQRKNHQHH